MDLAFSFDLDAGPGVMNNGNVATIINNLNNDHMQNFTYDELNRIKTAQSQATAGGYCWGLSYACGIWANLHTRTVTKCSAPALSLTINTQNQITNPGFTYDAAGNLINDGSHTYQYDAENRLVSADGGPTTTIYVTQGISGRVLSEVAGDGTWQKEYFYLNGQLLASHKRGQGLRYHFSDHRGTPRVITGQGGGLVARHDYCPYGQERTAWTDGENMKFTGQERDAESDQDYFRARYYAFRLGRFSSPDPVGGRQENPQTLNRYVYTVNNPLKYIDPNGLDFYLVGGDACGDSVECDPGGYVVDDEGARVVVKSEEINTADDGPRATVNEQGLLITTERGTFQGAFITDTGPLQVAGSEALEGFTFTFTGNCEGNCLVSGTFTFAGTPVQAQRALQAPGFANNWWDTLNFHHPSSWWLGQFTDPYKTIEYRSPGHPTTGFPSGHFTVFQPVQLTGTPWLPLIQIVPQAKVPATGDLHFGEHRPFTSLESTWEHLEEQF